MHSLYYTNKPFEIRVQFWQFSSITHAFGCISIAVCISFASLKVEMIAHYIKLSNWYGILANFALNLNYSTHWSGNWWFCIDTVFVLHIHNRHTHTHTRAIISLITRIYWIFSCVLHKRFLVFFRCFCWLSFYFLFFILLLSIEVAFQRI